ncbi:uncharacterized protein LOC141868680 [Acropora palmata]|uniref:uncharacterized protein LOC141868680 n=1 Tax=Acropora palmata TaxID=6131 RepID=UPI003DA11506
MSRQHSQSLRSSACSNATGTGKKQVDSTLTLLKHGRRLDKEDDTQSFASSHWDTDLEDDFPGKDKGVSDKETYLKTCDALGVTPVSRFGNEIGQEEIKINHRFLKGMGMTAIASALLRNKTTSKLNIAHNELSIESGKCIGRLLKSNRALTELNLANNNIRKEGIIAIAQALPHNDTIRKLDLARNGLGDSDARLLAEGIAKNDSLFIVNLSYNNFSEASGVSFGDALTYNNSLLELDLSWNFIRRAGEEAIAKSLRYNSSLEKLNLSWNGLDDCGTKELGESLKRNSTIKELDISNNRISDKGLINIAVGIEGSDKLEVLNVSHNLIFGSFEGVKKVLEGLHKNGAPALRVLGILDIKLDHECQVLLDQLMKKRGNILSVMNGCKKPSNFITKKKNANPVDFLRAYLNKNKIHASDLFKSLGPGCQFRDSLSREVFMNGMRRLKVMEDPHLVKLVAILDTDGDGEIDYSEFVKMFFQRQ